MSLLSNLTFVAILGSGLMAGTFFAFSSFVMGALRSLPHADATAAMRRINAQATRSPFLVAFTGMAFLSVYLAVTAKLRFGEMGMPYLLLGGLGYFMGTFGVTAVGNVPLNRRLDSADDSAVAWKRYVAGWTLWNHLRTTASLFALWTFTMSYVDQTHGYPIRL